ncbi:MAG: hypothetical protein ACK4NY_12635 [Spirosomataceae bacterium]
MEHKKSKLTKPMQKIGQFATIEEAAQHKTAIVNEMLSKISNFDEFFNSDGTRK